ncbi:hypothetical protein, partial [Verrucosispora sp. SN26_14.1]|uniref:hypothetical protein n=1 Tax=Verrucosispora sp. SN26_14.1 TaxID=2527879 RepID=UPI001F199AB2
MSAPRSRMSALTVPVRADIRVPGSSARPRRVGHLIGRALVEPGEPQGDPSAHRRQRLSPIHISEP